MLTACEKLTIIRKRKNITVGEMAEKSGMTRQNLANKFNRNNLQEDDIQKFASALGCKVEIVFTDLETNEQV